LGTLSRNKVLRSDNFQYDKGMTKIGTNFNFGPAVSFLFSCLVHALILVFVIGPYIDVALQRDEMVLELKEEPKEAPSERKREKREMAMRMTRPASGEKSNPSSSEQKSKQDTETGELPERMDFAPEDEDTEKVLQTVESERTEDTLRRVRRSIASVWRQADPPCPGIAELRLKLAPSGELVSVWITRLKGRSELGEYLRGLLDHAAPYSRAMNNATRPVVFDCRFEISGPEKTGKGNRNP
jgi:hypothetical protein